MEKEESVHMVKNNQAIIFKIILEEDGIERKRYL